MNRRQAALEGSLNREDPRAIDSEEARALRRRMQFWRSLSGMLLVGVLLLLTVFWLRRHGHRDRCRFSLEHYARLAQTAGFDRLEPELIVLQWPNLDQGDSAFHASHYVVVPGGWRSVEAAADAPLAVCNSVHGTLLGDGRNVLIRHAGKLVVEWRPESEVKSVADQARRHGLSGAEFRLPPG